MQIRFLASYKQGNFLIYSLSLRMSASLAQKDAVNELVFLDCTPYPDFMDL